VKKTVKILKFGLLEVFRFFLLKNPPKTLGFYFLEPTSTALVVVRRLSLAPVVQCRSHIPHTIHDHQFDRPVWRTAMYRHTSHMVLDRLEHTHTGLDTALTTALPPDDVDDDDLPAHDLNIRTSSTK